MTKKNVEKKAVSKKTAKPVKQDVYTNERGELRVKMEIDGVMIDREV